jgi:ATP-dependent RNA helicase HelY
LRRDTDALQQRVESRTNTIARTFDRVCLLLESLGYLRRDAVTASGRMLAGLYAESDLLVAECLREAVWQGLAPAELAACVSALVYESRQADDVPARVPAGRVREALGRTALVWARLAEAEGGHRLSFLRRPDPGFAWAAYRWALGDPLDEVLDGGELAAGDFVRWMRQLLDLLDQLAKVAPADVAAASRSAVDLLRRGVVAYSSVG